ncbi:hypothetical protein Dia5BBH33_08590 [Dialister hominis]|uniref:Uncharacterized protein n=1 Tax=Dialister hominis TaxID=2582419 RepID=A0A8D5A4H4_9FIRM|nr:hypothetical protein Dia5BBH33_03960 [Dialister hominis]BBK24924.1 hypothetical protein Dia5BBH33_08590 [Dialister hominis]
MMDGDGSDAGNGLAFCNTHVSLPEVHIILLECQHLANTHTGVKQNEHRINTGLIAVCPKPINFLPTEWMVWMYSLILAD